VDSAAVASSATVVSRGLSLPDPLALSYLPPDPRESEEAAQRAIAVGLSIPLRIVPLADGSGPQGLLAAALELTSRAWLPPVNPWEPIFVHLAREGAGDGCRVILSGEGGNDWFEAERHEAADLLRCLKLAELASLWSAERRAGRSAFASARMVFWERGVRVLLRHAALSAEGIAAGTLQAVQKQRLTSWMPRGWFLPDDGLRAALADEWAENRAVDWSESFRDSARERRLDGVHMVVLSENRFLFGKEVGVRFANPALDPDLVEFLYPLPTHLLNLAGRGKGLACESVRRRAGETAARNLGLGVSGDFFANLLRGEGARAFVEVGGLRQLSELGLVEPHAFADHLLTALGKTMSYYQAWQALACEAWLRSPLRSRL
jgi:hypothetical protein